MSGVDEFHGRRAATPIVRQHRNRTVVADRLKLSQRARRVDRCVERQRRAVPAVLVAVRRARVLLLEVRRVGQHQRTQVLRRRRTKNTAAITTGDQARQIAAVVEVGVRQDDRVEARRIDRKRLPVPQTQLFQSLEQATIDQNRLAANLEQMLRAGDRSGGP